MIRRHYMNQTVFLILVNIATSIFFGIISNWIYDLLRERGVIPDKATPKTLVIIVLVGLVFIILTIQGNNFADTLMRTLSQKLTVDLWLLLASIFLSFLVGLFARRKKYKALLNQLQKKQAQLDDCEKGLELSSFTTQDIQQNGIINPK